MLVYASPSLYRIFCQVTGYGGTTQVAAELPSADEIVDRNITVRFNANHDSTLDWDFEPDELSTTIKIGENGLGFYTVTNHDNEPVKAMASYNVTPLKAGKYFNKVFCFCFEEQLIPAGKEIQYPVSFFIDPRFAEDEYMDDVDTITLSYTFFRIKEEN